MTRNFTKSGRPPRVPSILSCPCHHERLASIFMKTILISVSAFLVSLTSFAQTQTNVQYIDCHFDDVNMEDRVIVSLNDENTGTFFYSTGLDSEGTDNRTGKLKLNRVADDASQKDLAQFKAVYQGDDYGKPVTIEFTFAMPKAQIFKSSNFFHAYAGNGMGYSGGLNCFARIYPKN